MVQRAGTPGALRRVQDRGGCCRGAAVRLRHAFLLLLPPALVGGCAHRCYRIDLAAWSTEETTADRTHLLHGCAGRPGTDAPAAPVDADPDEDDEAHLRAVLAAAEPGSAPASTTAAFAPIARARQTT